MLARDVSRDEPPGSDLYGFVVGPLGWEAVGGRGAALIAAVVTGALGAISTTSSRPGTSNTALFHSALTPHPGRALRRRLWCATANVVTIAGVLTRLVLAGVIPSEAIREAVAS